MSNEATSTRYLATVHARKTRLSGCAGHGGRRDRGRCFFTPANTRSVRAGFGHPARRPRFTGKSVCAASHSPAAGWPTNVSAAGSRAGAPSAGPWNPVPRPQRWRGRLRVLRRGVLPAQHPAFGFARAEAPVARHTTATGSGAPARRPRAWSASKQLVDETAVGGISPRTTTRGTAWSPAPLPSATPTWVTPSTRAMRFPQPGTTRRRQSDQRVTAAHPRHEEEPRDFTAADARPHSKGGPDRTPPREPRPGEAGNTKGRRRLPRGGSLEFRPGGCPRRAPQRPRASRDGNGVRRTPTPCLSAS